MLDSGNLFCAGGNSMDKSSYIFHPESKYWIPMKYSKFAHIKPYIVQIGCKIFVVNIMYILNKFNFIIII